MLSSLEHLFLNNIFLQFRKKSENKIEDNTYFREEILGKKNVRLEILNFGEIIYTKLGSVFRVDPVICGVNMCNAKLIPTKH
jgi:hypothetical protein